MALDKFFGSRHLRACKALDKFFGSRHLRAPPQGYSPWTSLAGALERPFPRRPPLARSGVGGRWVLLNRQMGVSF